MMNHDNVFQTSKRPQHREAADRVAGSTTSGIAYDASLEVWAEEGLGHAPGVKTGHCCE